MKSSDTPAILDEDRRPFGLEVTLDLVFEVRGDRDRHVVHVADHSSERGDAVDRDLAIKNIGSVR
jgi:hypothetical protein